MKRILSIICASLITVVIEAQTIHWITFIDTTDPNVGAVDIFGREMLYNDFILEVNAALAQKGYKSDIHDYYGSYVSPENCKKVIEEIEIGDPNDIIVFYYIGHGGRPSTDADYMRRHPYPQLCLAQRDQSKFIPLEWVDEQLSSKGARLSVTIGMCCNSIASEISVKEEPHFSLNYGPTYMSSNKIRRIQELFLGTRGHIIATSASPSQTSITRQIGGMMSVPIQLCPWFHRDVYTYTICCFFKNRLEHYNRTMTWDDFLDAVAKDVDTYTNHKQTPIHKVYVAQAPKIITKKPTAPTVTKIQETKQRQKKELNEKQQTVEKPSENTPKIKVIKKVTIEEKKEIDMWKNELTNHLTTLINVQLPDTERFELERKLSVELFASGAQVKFLGQDSDDVIDRADVSDWLGILATNPNGRILMVNVVEGSFDSNNKIKSLKVREVYKK